MKLLSTELKDAVLHSMIEVIDHSRRDIIAANQRDLSQFDSTDRAMYDRLIVDDKKIDGMIQRY